LSWFKIGFILLVVIGLSAQGFYYLSTIMDNMPTSTPEYSFTEEKTLYHSGFRYEGEYQNDIPEGFGRLFDAEGRLRYKGQWKAGDPHGFGTSFYENGSIKFQGEWSKGVSVFK
tara:strand:- start:251 stop:592 length:342 start_codon:yes stop_codon:yes gene_type:complete